MLISGKSKELYDKVSMTTFAMAVVPTVSALLAGGACWVFGGRELLSFGGASAAAALLGAAVSLGLRHGLLGNLGGSILELASENERKDEHTASAGARSLVTELRELLRQAGEEDLAERREMEEALARAGERARETLELLDAAREKLAPVARPGRNGGDGAVV